MASRSWTTPALVLSLNSFGESHREAVLLTADRGLIKAAVFGGPKSSLRGLVSPWHSGTAWIYSDPVKNSHKITDFSVDCWRTPLRENLVRTWAANLASELCLRSHGTADWTLINAFLDGITVSNEAECRIGTLRFLWRFLIANGTQPDLSECSLCGSTGQNSQNGVLYYTQHEDTLLCRACVRPGQMSFPVGTESRQYLEAVGSLPPAQVRAVQISDETTAELRNLLFFLTARLVGGPLHTIEAGAGIL